MKLEYIHITKTCLDTKLKDINLIIFAITLSYTKNNYGISKVALVNLATSANIMQRTAYRKIDELIKNEFLVVTDDGLISISPKYKALNKIEQSQNKISNKENNTPYDYTKSIEKKLAFKKTINDMNVKMFLDKFYEEYPKIENKMQIEQYVNDNKQNIINNKQKILNAIKEHKESKLWSIESGRYIPNAINYLSNERWTDILPKNKSDKVKADKEDWFDELYKEL